MGAGGDYDRAPKPASRRRRLDLRNAQKDDDRLYLVEFSDGEAVEIPENFIEAMKDE